MDANPRIVGWHTSSPLLHETHMVLAPNGIYHLAQRATRLGAYNVLMRRYASQRGNTLRRSCLNREG